VTSSFIFYLSR